MRFNNSYCKIIVLRLVFATLLLGTFVGAQGQDSFHRVFPSQFRDNLSVLGGTQLKDGGYATLNILVSPEGKVDTSRSFVVTKYEKKGDVTWNFKFTLPDTIGTITPANCSLIQAASDSIYFTLVTERTNAPALILGSISSMGNLGNIKTISTIADTYDFSNTKGYHLTKGEKSFYSGFMTKNLGLAETHISRYDNLGVRLFTKGMSAKDSLKNLYQDIRNITNNESNVAFTGIVDSTNIKPYLTVMDTSGVVKWSNTYNDITFDLGISVPYDVAVLKDSSFIIAGVSREIKLNSFDYRGFVIKTTKTGEVDWAKKIVFSDADSTVVKFVETNLQDQIVVSGINKTSEGKIYDFLIKLDLTGKEIWKKKYPVTTSNGSELGALVATADSGTMLFANVIDESLQCPSMIKTNVDGITTCQEDIVENILFDNVYSVDTLVWNSRDLPLFEENIIVEDDVYQFNIPVIRLEPKSFCIKETVNHLFKSNIKGATNYKWSTDAEGTTLDSLRVMAIGDYSLTVTVGEKACYVLCSDVMLKNYEKPTTKTDLKREPFCETDKKTVYTRATSDVGLGIKSYVWSTGQSGANLTDIQISGTGTYIVTITDTCDEQEVSMITVNDFPKKITAVQITGSIKLDCYDGGYKGTLVATGNAEGNDVNPQRYSWSNGTTSNTLVITNDEVPRIYTVTVTDDCNVTATAQTSIAGNGDAVEISQINVSREGLCDLGELRLNASTVRAGSRLTYLWSSGQNTPSILIKTPGTYTVSVTDLCANTDTETIEILSTDFAPEKIRFAKVFFPEALGITYESADSLDKANVLLNRTFGPIDKDEYCIRGITDYEFFIYNRWGQTVFKTNEVEEEWDGKIDGKLSASDTYIYLARYKVNGVELLQKGDVDLIR